MGNGKLLTKHMEWVTLTTIAIVVFVVDAAVIANPALEESVAYSNESNQQTYRKDLAKRVNYDGDQVWRIYKHNDSVNELVQHYDEYGCT